VTTQAVAIAGAGRLAQAIGRALCDAGIEIVCVANRTKKHAEEAAASLGAPVAVFADLGRHATHVLIAVSDSAITPVAAQIASSPGHLCVALHTCGAYGPEPLHPLADAGVSCGSLHPLQTIRSPEDSAALQGIAFAISGDPGALAWAQEIAAALQGRTFEIASERRNLYHAAAAMASNHLTAVLDAAGEMMQTAGLPPAAVWPALALLVRTTIENALRYGPVQALTGPVSRGDAGTVAAHLGCLDGDLRALYQAAATRALNMATRRGLDEESAKRVRKTLFEGQWNK
jgi:predicted short-subunit dehydrogenase-like oxidoreductase (DUF2520 family)